MDVFVAMLNIERAVDRRQLMLHELNKANISAAFTPTFDWKIRGIEELSQFCVDRNAWGEFFSGNMATTISHSFAWEQFLASSAQWCLVLEDDVFISSELSHWLQDMSWWPKDADLVKIERWIDDRALVLLDKKCTSFLGRDIRRMRSRYMGAAGYLITRKTAEKLLAERPFSMVIDHLLFNINYSPFARQAVIYQISPALVRQGNEPEARVVYQSGRANTERGFKRLGQKVRRGLLELALPFSSYWSWITGRASLCAVNFRDSAPSER